MYYAENGGVRQLNGRAGIEMRGNGNRCGVIDIGVAAGIDLDFGSVRQAYPRGGCGLIHQAQIPTPGVPFQFGLRFQIRGAQQSGRQWIGHAARQLADQSRGWAVAPIVGIELQPVDPCPYGPLRSEEHTSELQSLMRNSYSFLFLTQ